MKTTLAALILTLFMTPAMSHDHDGGKDKGMRMLEHMDEKLNLSDEQRSQMETLFKEQHEKRQELRAETKNRMQDILDTEQQARLEQLKAERKANWKQKHKAHKECMSKHASES